MRKIIIFALLAVIFILGAKDVKEPTKIDKDLYKDADKIYFNNMITGEKYSSEDEKLLDDFKNLISRIELTEGVKTQEDYDGIFSYDFFTDGKASHGGAFRADSQFNSYNVKKGSSGTLYSYQLRYILDENDLIYIFDNLE